MPTMIKRFSKVEKNGSSPSLSARAAASIMLIFAAFLCVCQPVLAAGTARIYARWVITPTEEGELVVLQRQTIVLENGKIIDVRSGYEQPSSLTGDASADARVIDFKDKYVLPGLIDGHVHLTAVRVGNRREDRVVYSDADRVAIGVGAARLTLEAGFTTVRDLGARGVDAIYALRDGIERGDIIGPTLITSGMTITPTGGHVDNSAGYRPKVRDQLISSGVCDGPDRCVQAVRTQIRNSAEAIKVTATGGVLSAISAGLGKQFSDEELRAIVSTAHALGRKVTAHAHSRSGIDASLDAGVNSIEHGTYLGDTSIKRFLKNDAYLVPTMLAGDTVSAWARARTSPLPTSQKKKAAGIGPQMKSAVAKAHQAGVKIAFGSDSGMAGHGIACREFELLVGAGLTSQQALETSLVHAADNIGVADRKGRVAAGYDADFIVLEENPLADITRLCAIHTVIKSGVRVK